MYEAHGLQVQAHFQSPSLSYKFIAEYEQKIANILHIFQHVSTITGLRFS